MQSQLGEKKIPPTSCPLPFTFFLFAGREDANREGLPTTRSSNLAGERKLRTDRIFSVRFFRSDEHVVPRVHSMFVLFFFSASSSSDKFVVFFLKKTC